MNLFKSLKSFKFAVNGIISAIKKENNLKIQLLAGLIALIVAFLLPLNNTERQLILLWVCLIPSAEMFNSAIEKICDKVIQEKDEDIRIIKDISAGAVLWLSIGALIHGLWIFWPYFRKIISAE